MHTRFFFVMVVVLLSVGCSNRRIPGTDIDDNDDTRAILKVMERFRAAVEAKDANAVAQLVTPDFKEDGGSSDPEDDYDASNLAQKLAQQLGQVKDIRLGMDVKKITFDEDEAVALVTYYWNLRYELPSLSQKPHLDSELKQTVMKKAPDGWRIASGI